MTLQAPLVSIGMPVFNAERYLRRALDAVLAQDFSDFELILSDNGSTDGTEAICREYAARDSRIRYVRQDENLGALRNFTFVLEQARGEFFMWAAHDDAYAPTFVSRCLEQLNQCPRAVACCSEIIFLDERGRQIAGMSYVNIDTNGMSATERIFELIKRFNWYATYSLYRRDVLLKTPPLCAAFGLDVISLLNILLLGDIVKVPESLFYYTIPDQNKSIDNYLSQIGVTDLEKRERPYSDLLVNLWNRVWKSQLTPKEKTETFLGFISILNFQNPIWRQIILREHPEWGGLASHPDHFPRLLGTMLLAVGGPSDLRLDEASPSQTVPAEPSGHPAKTLSHSASGGSAPKVVIDGVFFQLNNTGIARLWRSILAEWAKEDFGKQIVVLDRGGTLPDLPGIQTVRIPHYRYEAMDLDPFLLEWFCRKVGAGLFVSTYYSTPVETPSLFVGYDMIPEATGMNLREASWVAKHAAIRHARHFAAISESTARDLHQFFPEVPLEAIDVVHLAASPVFHPPAPEEIADVKSRMGIKRPYFLTVGYRHDYKNGRLFFEALASLPDPKACEVVCVGGLPELEPEFANLVPGVKVHMVRLSDDDLRAAYGGAAALVYPSRYEGFGLPILEAMACGCPVIACRCSSIPEVGGDAILYASEVDPADLARALLEVMDPDKVKELRAKGLTQVRNFSWAGTAKAMKETFLRACQDEAVDPQGVPSAGDPEILQELLDQAHEALRTGDFDRAQELLTALVDGKPDHVPAYRALAELLERKGDLEMARKVLEAGLDQNPKAVELWEELIAFSATHQPERVAPDAWSALGQAPDGGAGVWHEVVAQALVAEGRVMEARQVLAKGLVAFPENAELHDLARGLGPEPPPLPRTSVFCALWHKDPKRWELAKGHQACLDAQTVPVDRVYVLDGGDEAPEWLKGTILRFDQPLGIYEAWAKAQEAIETPYLMNLNLDDRLNPEAVAIFEKALDAGMDLVGGDWEICFSQGETDRIGPIRRAGEVPFEPAWPPAPGRSVRLGSGTGERGTLGPSTAWRRALHQELGPYPRAFSDGSPVRVIGDSLWWRRVQGAGKKVLRLPYLVGRYHSHPGDQAEFRNPAAAEEEKLARIGLSSQ